MYIPDRYKNTNRTELIDFIRKNMFGIIVVHDGNKPVATHIPMMVQEANGKQFLIGHISKENEQGKIFYGNPKALAIFQGPHAYVSSSWYHHDNVSTWNYIAVHVYGSLSVMTELELYEHLIGLTNSMEAHSEKPKYFEHIGERVIRDNVTGVTGFKMTIEKMEASFKLSQNRDETDHQNIIHELEKRGDASSLAIAEEMKKRGHA
jgi:transcriptional regulator